MPLASVWLIRAALLQLVAAATLGAWLLAAKGGAVGPRPGWLAGHAAMALLGWMVQVTLGVGYWILPRMAAGPERGPPWAPWVTLVLLNLGVGAVAAGRAAAGLAAAAAGIAVFVGAAVPRIKPFGAGR